MPYGKVPNRSRGLSSATAPVPVLFLAHGSPLLALEPGGYAAAMAELAAGLPPVRAVVVISAHWTTDRAVGVTAARQPEQLYDFGGFPLELYRIRYRPKGDPQRAQQIVTLLEQAGIKARLDAARGLDHGAWVPLRFLFPRANVPVTQVALPHPAPPEQLMALGAALAPLSRQGVLLMGSGGIVHNLEVVQLRDQQAPAQPWAVEFEQWMLKTLEQGDREALVRYREEAPFAALAAGDSEHLDPLFVAAGAAGADAAVRPVYQEMQYGNLSLLSLAFGGSGRQAEPTEAAG